MRKGGKKTAFARHLRQKQTDAEKALWARLRSKQLDGVKFRRQQPIGQYIVDLVSFEKKLVIEIDGGHHNEPSPVKGEGMVLPPPAGGSQREGDEERTRWLRENGYQVLRFWNNEVMRNIEGVLETIREAVMER